MARKNKKRTKNVEVDNVATGDANILNGVIIGTKPNKKNAFWGPFFAHIFRHYQGKIKAI